MSSKSISFFQEFSEFPISMLLKYKNNIYLAQDSQKPKCWFFYMLCKNSLHVSNPFTNLSQMHLIYRLIQNTVNVDTLYWKVQHDELLMKDHQLSQGIVKLKSRSEADICSDKENFFFHT